MAKKAAAPVKPAKKPAKKPVKKAVAISTFNAAGLDRVGVLEVVNGEEFLARGTMRHPFSKKAEMVEACNGLTTLAEIKAKIGELSRNA